MTSKKIYLILMVIPLLFGCSSVVLKPVNYAWPIEDVLKVDANGFVNVERYSMLINVKPIYFLEKGDSTKAAGQEIRVIRDVSGYFYFTATGFKNVYVFETGTGTMSLENTILIDPKGLTSPAMNQKNPYIELIDGTNSYLLTSKGIKR